MVSDYLLSIAAGVGDARDQQRLPNFDLANTDSHGEIKIWEMRIEKRYQWCNPISDAVPQHVYHLKAFLWGS